MGVPACSEVPAAVSNAGHAVLAAESRCHNLEKKGDRIMTEAERNEALIKQWKQALFENEGPGGKIEMDELDSILGATSIAGGCSNSCCPKCTANCTQ